MKDEERLAALLDDLIVSQRSPEEVCASCPELLPQVRRRWRQMRRVRAQLDLLFPPSSDGAAHSTHRHADEPVVPIIEGYEIETVLGRGGMGVVYRARHLRLNRMVALKMLLAGSYAGREESERFLHEAQIVAGLCHPNIVQLYDVANVEGRPYFTMELVEGGSLAHKLSGTPLSALDAANLLAKLAAAVETAHESGIIHRDLKPANVLLSADGTPKITDFGLARELESGLGLTLTGAPLGTPSYMAPEQARGEKIAVGPATDVYSLGAILYECLTGRPPFRAESPTATLQQVLSDEPVSPARLNPRVPRDLETICMKCLSKEPQKRYVSAQALAEDLRRFESGEPIKARRVGPLERAAHWVRRRPALAGALASGMLLASALIGTVLWWHGQETALKAAAVSHAEADLSESERMRDRGEFAASAAVLERARERLGQYVPLEQRDRLRAAFDNLELVTQLDAILMRSSVLRDKDYELDMAQADQEYEEAFRSAALGTVQEEAKDVASRIGDSPVRKALVAALDDWAVCATDTRRRAWLLQVALLADPDPWRDRVRDPSPQAWADRERLAELARTAPVAQESVQLLDALGRRLQDAGGREEVVTYLRRVQQAHPGDFYANNMLGNSLFEMSQYGDAAGYFRAALAVRPDSTIAWANLGLSLSQLGQLDEARIAYEESLHIDPANGWARVGIGEVLRRQGQPDLAIEHLQRALPLLKPSSRLHREFAFALQERKRWAEAIAQFRTAAALSPDMAWHQYDLAMALNTPGNQDEAIEYLRKTLALNPRYPSARVNLVRILFERGRVEEAIAELRRAIELDPTDTSARADLRAALARLGRWQEVQAAWRMDLDAGPPKHDDWFGYAELCLFLKDEEEYRKARSDLLAQFGSTKDPVVAERTGRACLLLPAAEKELRQAVALAERAVAAERLGREFAYPYCLFAEGLARYRQGRFDDAIELMTGEAASVMEPCPGLILAMTQFKKGQREEARKTLDAAVTSYDWSAAKAEGHDAWIAHILRREAETLILLSN